MRSFITIAFLILVAAVAFADEGMWMPSQLPDISEELEAYGLKIEPAQLADLEGYPMGAVVSLGGCTASFVSATGLVVTNHHCAMGSIHYNSTEERNIIGEGFLARSIEEELPARPGSRIYVAVETTDVSDRVLKSVPEGADGTARYGAIETIEKTLVAACEEDPGHRCRVSSYYGGLLYVLIKQLEIRDVRLVYAPPESVGNFGGDIDNWMWPRHTGDYSFLRAYVAKDGSAADPAPDNVPYQPKHWLKVAPQGVGEGDLVMVVGYPGSTSRYRLADEVKTTFEQRYPERVVRYSEMLDTIKRETADRTEATMKYAAVTGYINNGLKNTKGMLTGYAHSDMLERKSKLEDDLQAWIESDDSRQEKWGSALNDVRVLVGEDWSTHERDGVAGSLKRGTLLATARKLVRNAYELQLPDAERTPGYQDRDMARIKAGLMRLDKSFDSQVDRALFVNIIRRAAALPADQRFKAIDAYFGLSGETFDEAAVDRTLETMYSKTSLPNREVRLGLVDASVEELQESGDPFLELALLMYPEGKIWEEKADEYYGRLVLAKPKLMEAILEYQNAAGKTVYPDANSTLRVTYGTVKGYEPRDAVVYAPFSKAQGILEKNTGDKPFNSTQELLGAIRKADFGPYALPDSNHLSVDFLSTVDTTGGNSGSPTLDAEGRLVGLLFDGNWESIIADWDFLPAITRSIHVDIRYVLWVMDRIHGASNLLREMGIEPAFGEQKSVE